MITKEQIQQAHQRIKPYIHHTPIIHSQTIANMAECKLFSLKCQNLQKIGAFKARGAFNKILQLQKSQTMVCTHSSGNHAQALAYAAKVLGFNAKIVMPQNSPEIKKLSVKGYGAQVIISGNTLKQREQKCQQVQQQYNAIFCHPYNDKDIVCGQATSAKEVFQSQYNYDYLVFPIGGGGLASGSILSTKYFGKNCKAIGVEPYLARDAFDSLNEKKIKVQYPPLSIADGLRTSLGPLTYQIISSYLSVDDLILVSEEQIILATKIVFERMKLVIEPSSATVVAAVLKDQRFKGKNVCCIISGGNIDMNDFWKSLQDKAKL